MKAARISRRRKSGFSLSRAFAVFMKELIQMRRDRLTFGMMLGIPVMQLLLFGYAINTDPRHMPAAVEMRDNGPMARAFLAGLKASTFVDIVAEAHGPDQADEMLRSGKVVFVIEIPEKFEEKLVHGDRPQILMAADASDPVAIGGVIGAVNEIAQRAFAPDLARLPQSISGAPPPYEIVVHKRYNPAGITAFNIVPGLLGVILTMTLVMITSIALTREIERGTMEALLSTPVRPAEVMVGKTTPYVIVGGVQTLLVLGAARLLFDVPFMGDFHAFALGVAIFIFANLMLGYLISTVARTQMQAMQMTFFVFLPSILLSGFMFPFQAMPAWARAIGECLPLTHFLRILRAVMLKGAGLSDIAGSIAPLLAILFVLVFVALRRFRRTLD